MKSYLNNPQLKQDFLEEIIKHRKADQITQGHYGEENGQWSGCAVACSLRSLAILDGEELETQYNNHKLYEEKLGIPEWLARLEDKLFEGMEAEGAKVWPERFAEAVPVGVDLEPVKYEFCAYLMRVNQERVKGLDIDDELKQKLLSAIKQVENVHNKALETGDWDESAAESALSAARSATESAWSAWSAARSATKSAESEWSAWSAARSAAWSAIELEWSAAESADSAESAEHKRFADHLLKIIRKQK